MARLRAEAGESWQENYKTLTNCLQGGEVLLSGVTGGQLALKHWWHDENGTRWHFYTAPFEDREVWHSVMNLPVTPGELFAIHDTLPAGAAHHRSPAHAKVAEAGAGSLEEESSR
jgi:hypothetical protein